MVDLSTQYLGIALANPLIVGASPMSKDCDLAKRCEDAGAAALVMSSLFEEKIEAEQQKYARFFYQQAIGHGEADSFHPVSDSIKTYQEHYLEHLQTLKKHLAIPVMGSLNGTSMSGWLDYGRALQEAGADALELNLYYLAADGNEDSATVEARYLTIIEELKRHIHVPIAVKLSEQFSSLVHFATRIEAAGAEGLVLFNRFYQPDIDLETLHVMPKLELSTSAESLLRIRWTAMLAGRVKMSLAVTGGFHERDDILKALLAGADAVQLCSALLLHGSAHLRDLLHALEHWLEEHDYDSVVQCKGSVSQQHAIEPAAYARANYVHILDSYSSPTGVLR